MQDYWEATLLAPLSKSVIGRAIVLSLRRKYAWEQGKILTVSGEEYGRPMVHTCVRSSRQYKGFSAALELT